MNPDELEQIIKDCLNAFYRRRIENLSKLRLHEVLKRKNPYLMRAIGLRTAAGIGGIHSADTHPGIR
jgi:hypothetical protein